MRIHVRAVILSGLSGWLCCSEASGADGTWVARLKSPPVDGKANAELIELIAEHFGCRRSAVSIKSGAGGRIKLVRIET